MTRTTATVLTVLLPAVLSGGRAAAADIGWQPPGGKPDTITIEQAVEEALNRNLALTVERYGVSTAAAAVLTAGLRPNPVLTANLMRPDRPLVQSGIATDEEVVRADYVIERGDKRDRRIEQATLTQSITELQLADATRRLILEVQTGFADVQLAKRNLALAEENLAAFNSVVSINAVRVSTGDLAKVELSRSRLAALQFENDVQQQAARLTVARSRLAVLIGRGPEDVFDVDGDLRRDAAPVDRAALERQALLLRPDLQAARRDQARSVSDLRLQLANGKVDFTLSGEYHHVAGGGLTGSNYGLFFSAPLPIFNRNQGEVARAEVQSRQVDAKTRVLQTEIIRDVDDAFTQYDTARRIVERIENQMLTPAREVRTTMEYSYRRGEASLIEFLDAVRAFNDTTRSYNEARADYARSLYELDAMVGAVTP